MSTYETAYLDDLRASTAVILVVVLELVDLDALAIIERRSGECHHQPDADIAPLPGKSPL
jgi:hypothetical protein